MALIKPLTQRLLRQFWRLLGVLIALGLLVFVVLKLPASSRHPEPTVATADSLEARVARLESHTDASYLTAEMVPLSRAREFIYVAEQLLVVNHDGRGAQNYLQQALTALDGTNSNWLAPLRRALNQDISALNHYNHLGLSNVLQQLQTISQGADGFALASDRTTAIDATPPVKIEPWPNFSDAPKAWLHRFALEIWAPFRNLIHIQRLEEGKALYIPASQAHYVKAQLRLMLLNARLALLQQQPSVAMGEINQAIIHLERYFNTLSPGVRGALNALNKMKEMNFPNGPPMLSSLLTADGLRQTVDDGIPSSTSRADKP